MASFNSLQHCAICFTQGQEVDNEIKGEGNSVNYKYRMHDPRLGRFFAVDPLASSYPHYTPYSFSGNKVIAFVELEGLEEEWYFNRLPGKKPILTLGLHNFVAPKIELAPSEDGVFTVLTASIWNGFAQNWNEGLNGKSGAQIHAEGIVGMNDLFDRVFSGEADKHDVAQLSFSFVFGRISKGIGKKARIPRKNGTWSAEPGNSDWYSNKTAVLDITGGEGVPFRNNFPNFTKWSLGDFKVDGLTGRNGKDFSLTHEVMMKELNFSSKKSVKEWLKDNKITLHHHQDGKTIQLIPYKLHSNIPHSGGASSLRDN